MPIVKTKIGNMFEYKFTTTFEETNVVGNIYFANYLVWQGKCREMFIKEFCPDVLDEINNGLALITLDVSSKYFNQLYAFDQVTMHMNVEAFEKNRMVMNFLYYKDDDGKSELVCQGSQGAASMRLVHGKMCSEPFPNSMVEAIDIYQLQSAV